MLCVVIGGRPILAPRERAFATPERTRARIIESSNWLKTPAICKNASLIGSGCPLRQSRVMLPTITSRSFFSLMVFIISQSCCVLLANRETSKVMMVSPACAWSNICCCWGFIFLSPCSYSKYISSAPAAFSSFTCRLISCLLSLVEHLA